jgi:hypothetical protein
VSGLGPEAVSAVVCTLFNQGTTQIGAWLQARAEREAHERRVQEIESLERFWRRHFRASARLLPVRRWKPEVR